MSHQVCFTLGNCVPHGGAVADSVVCATRYLSQKCLATSRLDCTRLLMLRTRIIFPLSAVDDAHQWLMMTFYGLRFVILCMYVGCLMGPTDGRPFHFHCPSACVRVVSLCIRSKLNMEVETELCSEAVPAVPNNQTK